MDVMSITVKRKVSIFESTGSLVIRSFQNTRVQAAWELIGRYSICSALLSWCICLSVLFRTRTWDVWCLCEYRFSLAALVLLAVAENLWPPGAEHLSCSTVSFLNRKPFEIKGGAGSSRIKSCICCKFVLVWCRDYFLRMLFACCSV